MEFAGAVRPNQLLETISQASVGLALIQPICLSYRMSLPNKLFEYVAAGIPVLGSDLPAIGPLVREYGIGLVAQPERVADVASKLSKMLEPERNAAFRVATRRAAERLNWKRESQLLADAYVETAMAARRQPQRLERWKPQPAVSVPGSLVPSPAPAGASIGDSSNSPDATAIESSRSKPG